MGKAKKLTAEQAVDAKEATFAQWFEAQYGPCPTTEPEYELERIFHGRRHQMNMAEERLLERRKWDARRNTAHKAWSAAKDQKG